MDKFKYKLRFVDGTEQVIMLENPFKNYFKLSPELEKVLKAREQRLHKKKK